MCYLVSRSNLRDQLEKHQQTHKDSLFQFSNGARGYSSGHGQSPLGYLFRRGWWLLEQVRTSCRFGFRSLFIVIIIIIFILFVKWLHISMLIIAAKLKCFIWLFNPGHILTLCYLKHFKFHYLGCCRWCFNPESLGYSYMSNAMDPGICVFIWVQLMWQLNH